VILPGEKGAAGRLFACAYHSAASRRFQAAVSRGVGEIHAAGKVYKMRFLPAQGNALNAQIVRIYQAKYSGSLYCVAMNSPRARAATAEILPA